jgi:hypothetical protein
MASHLLGVPQSAVIFQVNGDAGCSPGVTSDRSQKARRFGPLSDAGQALYSGSKPVLSPPFEPNLRYN